MDKRNTESIVQEVMGMVDRYAEGIRQGVISEAQGDGFNQGCADFAKKKREAIEAKLRELLEREPLSDEQVAFLKHVHANSAYVGGDFEAGVRYGERAHEICNDSKGM